MITWMIKSLGMVLEIMLKVMLFGVSLFLTLSMNTFTIPLFVICLLFCKVFHLRRPGVGWYGLMLFPAWSDKSGSSMIAEMNDRWNKEQAKIKKPTCIGAWIEMLML